jgi:hypothetical protein
LSPPAFQLVDRARRGLWYEAIDPIEQVEGSQDPNQVDQGWRFPLLDALQGCSPDSGFLGQPGLIQVAVEAGSSQTAAELFEDDAVRILRRDWHIAS